MYVSIYTWTLSLYVVIVCCTMTVNSYELKPVVLPQDSSQVRIFTDDELARYDASDVCMFASCKCIHIAYFLKSSFITKGQLATGTVKTVPQFGGYGTVNNYRPVRHRDRVASRAHSLRLFCH